jgi:hypothetical protein
MIGHQLAELISRPQAHLVAGRLRSRSGPGGSAKRRLVTRLLGLPPLVPVRTIVWPTWDRLYDGRLENSVSDSSRSLESMHA